MTAPDRPGQPPAAPEPPVLEERAAADRDEAWGEPGPQDDDRRLLDERPPHHDGRSSW